MDAQPAPRRPRDPAAGNCWAARGRPTAPAALTPGGCSCGWRLSHRSSPPSRGVSPLSCVHGQPWHELQVRGTRGARMARIVLETSAGSRRGRDDPKPALAEHRGVHSLPRPRASTCGSQRGRFVCTPTSKPWIRAAIGCERTSRLAHRSRGRAPAPVSTACPSTWAVRARRKARRRSGEARTARCGSPARRSTSICVPAARL